MSVVNPSGSMTATSNHPVTIHAAGSRTIYDEYDSEISVPELFAKVLFIAGIDQSDIGTVVHGDNHNSPDGWGSEYANLTNDIDEEAFSPDWNNTDHPDAVVKEGKYGKYDARAGFRRNTEMAEFLADQPGRTHSILFWDGSSNGTDHMREQLIEHDIPTTIVLPTDDDADRLKSLLENSSTPTTVVSLETLRDI